MSTPAKVITRGLTLATASPKTAAMELEMPNTNPTRSNPTSNVSERGVTKAEKPRK